MLITTSITGTLIRLPDERWLHIVEGHPEVAGYLNTVMLAIASPDYVLAGNSDELIAAIDVQDGKYLVVIYKETNTDGFILTAFFTRKIDKLLNRKIIWQK